MTFPARLLRSFGGLLAGLLLLDVLLNLPGLTVGAVVGSLLAPSLDLLVVSAFLLLAAQAGETGRGPLRVLALAVLLLFAAYGAGKRFGFDAALHLFGPATAAAQAASCAVSLLVLGAAAAIGWLATGLVLRGFKAALTRSVFMAMVAIAAILQVLTGNRVLAPSVVPRIVRDIAALFS